MTWQQYVDRIVEAIELTDGLNDEDAEKLSLAIRDSFAKSLTEHYLRGGGVRFWLGHARQALIDARETPPEPQVPTRPN